MYYRRSPVTETGASSDTATTGTFEVAGIQLDREDSRKAKVLYDYDAENEDELTLAAGDVRSTLQCAILWP